MVITAKERESCLYLRVPTCPWAVIYPHHHHKPTLHPLPHHLQFPALVCLKWEFLLSKRSACMCMCELLCMNTCLWNSVFRCVWVRVCGGVEGGHSVLPLLCWATPMFVSLFIFLFLSLNSPDPSACAESTITCIKHTQHTTKSQFTLGFCIFPGWWKADEKLVYKQNLTGTVGCMLKISALASH